MHSEESDAKKSRFVKIPCLLWSRNKAIDMAPAEMLSTQPRVVYIIMEMAVEYNTLVHFFWIYIKGDLEHF
ncbi:MAG TPA: hypothetical protein VGP47_08920 [Parachlamydiaceae bacterium]|nr:hypothetical protein [Parachlamydiaceae bacterium]